MVLFGAVAPVSSDEVLAIGVQQLGVTSSGEISWDVVRDALIREITFGGAKCPTEEVCRLLADFLQTAPSTPSSGALLGYDPAANGTGAIPLPV